MSDESSGAPSAASGVLALLAVTQFLMTVDATVMNVSITALVDDLDTSVTAIQGVITTYTLVMAAAMITGGKLGDILGRRRALRIGLVVYALGSGITAIAPNVVLLVGWSILEGLGAALIMPTVVALIAGNFEGQKRGRPTAPLRPPRPPGRSSVGSSHRTSAGVGYSWARSSSPWASLP